MVDDGSTDDTVAQLDKYRSRLRLISQPRRGVSAARNLGAADFAVMWQVILPAALPGIIAGLKVTLAIAWSCVLSAELVAAQSGLGALIWQGKDWGNLPLVLVGMLCISLTVLVADWLMVRLEHLLLPWERSRRS